MAGSTQRIPARQLATGGLVELDQVNFFFLKRVGPGNWIVTIQLVRRALGAH